MNYFDEAMAEGERRKTYEAADCMKPDYSEFDPEVVPLCRAMNDLPGICTNDSCCGHGTQPFRIFFKVTEKEHRGLFILARSVDRRYFKHGHKWSISLSVADAPESPLPLSFMLGSNARGEKAYEQAQDLVSNIFLHRKHKAFLEVYELQECAFSGVFNSRR